MWWHDSEGQELKLSAPISWSPHLVLTSKSSHENEGSWFLFTFGKEGWGTSPRNKSVKALSVNFCKIGGPCSCIGSLWQMRSRGKSFPQEATEDSGKHLAEFERNFQEALGSLEECQGTRAWWLLRGYLVQSMSSWGFQILVGSKIDLVDCKELFLKSKIEKGPLHSWEEVEVLGNFVSIVCVCVCAGLWCKIMYYHQL